MRIGVIGCGAMGTSIGRLWALAGHQVVFCFSRSARGLASATATAGEGAPVRPEIASLADAVRACDVLLLAIRWGQLDVMLSECGDLAGKPLIDCTLPMNAEDTALTIGLTGSGAEVVQQRSGACVVKAFNTIPSELLAQMPLRSKVDLFFAGDDMHAKRVASTLIGDAGFRPVDCGPLAAARQLEPLGLLMGRLAYVQEPSPVLGYRLVRSDPAVVQTAAQA